jgi:hypothetical protein
MRTKNSRETGSFYDINMLPLFFNVPATMEFFCPFSSGVYALPIDNLRERLSHQALPL